MIAFTDGATFRTNPGPSGIGVAYYKVPCSSPEGYPPDATLCEPIGHATNNEAEYSAVIRAIEHWVLELADGTDPKLEINSDSLLVVKQLEGDWKTKSKKLRPYQEQAKWLIELVETAGGSVSIRHIPREENEVADTLSKAAAGLAADEVE